MKARGKKIFPDKTNRIASYFRFSAFVAAGAAMLLDAAEDIGKGVLKDAACAGRLTTDVAGSRPAAVIWPGMTTRGAFAGGAATTGLAAGNTPTGRAVTGGRSCNPAESWSRCCCCNRSCSCCCCCCVIGARSGCRNIDRKTSEHSSNMSLQAVAIPK